MLRSSRPCLVGEEKGRGCLTSVERRSRPGTAPRPPVASSSGCSAGRLGSSGQGRTLCSRFPLLRRRSRGRRSTGALEAALGAARARVVGVPLLRAPFATTPAGEASQPRARRLCSILGGSRDRVGHEGCVSDESGPLRVVCGWAFGSKIARTGRTS